MDTTPLVPDFMQFNAVDLMVHCQSRGVNNFEHLRRPLPDCLLDIIDQLFEDGRPFFAKFESSRDAAIQFMNDPRALIDNRLGRFASMQR